MLIPPLFAYRVFGTSLTSHLPHRRSTASRSASPEVDGKSRAEGARCQRTSRSTARSLPQMTRDVSRPDLPILQRIFMSLFVEGTCPPSVRKQERRRDRGQIQTS